MPKFVDYPRGSLKRALEIAKAVQELGGSCPIETCADQLGIKVTGSFRSQLSAAIKYNFVNLQKGVLILTLHYKQLSLAYNEEEKIKLLRESVFNIPVFKSLYERFANGKLPINMLDKILIREFDVTQKIAGTVANYFIDAAREANLLNGDNSFVVLESGESNNAFADPNIQEDNKIGSSVSAPTLVSSPQTNNYFVSINGPGIQFQKELSSIDDFIVLNAIIQSIQKKFNSE
jgi:hypothetical protein